MNRSGIVLGCLLALLLALDVHAGVWPSSSDGLIRALHSGDVDERRAASGLLASGRLAVPSRQILLALDDDDVEVRVNAAHAARARKLRASSSLVLGWLGEGDDRLRLAACEVLREFPNPGALGALTRVLGDANAEVRLAAVLAASAAQDQRVVPALLGRLDDTDLGVREQAVLALGRLGDARAVVPLLGRTQDRDLAVRRAAVRVLSRLGDERSKSALLLCLRDGDLKVRLAAVRGLGWMGAPEVLPIVTEWIESPSDPEARDVAIDVLSDIATADTIPVLLKALQSDDSRADTTRARAALGRLGALAREPLRHVVLSSSSLAQVSGAALVLAPMGNERDLELIAAALQSRRIETHAALRAMQVLGSKGALAYAMAALEDDSAAQQAVETVSRLLDSSVRDGRWVDPIMAKLSTAGLDSRLRVSLILSLGRTGSARARTHLLSFSTSEDDAVRAASAQALGDVEIGENDDRLMELLSDASPRVRLAAGQSLARNLPEASLALLLRRLVRGAVEDRVALGIATSGVLARASDPEQVASAWASVRSVSSVVKDSLVEGLARGGHLHSDMARWMDSATVGERTKLAEGLAAGKGDLRWLRRLARDRSNRVRAAGVWSLGHRGSREDYALVYELAQSKDEAVSANAVASLGRLHERGVADAHGALCSSLRSPSVYARVNALAWLARLSVRCDAEDLERRLLEHDSNHIVRQQAARLLQEVGRGLADRRALAQCASEERWSVVRDVCVQWSKPRRVKEREPVTVFVVPDGEQRPSADAPFALVFADGTHRLGWSDQRGAVWEGWAPVGRIRLAAWTGTMSVTY